jgi:hypothetical protein
MTMTAIHFRALDPSLSALRRRMARLLKVLLLTALGVVLGVSGAQANLIFVSNPPDAMLDPDAPPDIEVMPGDSVDYFVSIGTFNLANIRGGPLPGILLAPVTRFSYRVKYDPDELRLDRFTLDLIDLFTNDVAGANAVQGFVDITHDHGNIAANNVRPLDQFFFTVVRPVNDGKPDFEFQNVLINTVPPPAGVFLSDQNDEVQPRPVSEPATLLLFGGAILGLLVALHAGRRHLGARSVETIQPLIRRLTMRRYRG